MMEWGGGVQGEEQAVSAVWFRGTLDVTSGAG